MTEMSRRRFLGTAVVLAGGVGAFATGCGTGSGGGGNDALSKIKKSKSIRIGTANFKPYSYSTTDGKLEGFVIDMISAAVKPLGIDKVVPTWVGDTSAYIPGLNANKYDVIANGMYIKPERCAQVGFTNPFYRAGMAMVVHKGNPKGIESVAGIAKDDKVKVATLVGTTQVTDLKTAKVPENRTVLFPAPETAVRALESKRVDAVYLPQPEAAGVVKDRPELAIATPYEQIHDDAGKPMFNHGSLAIRSKDTSLREALDERLAAMREDGTVLKILERYGLTEENLSEDGLTSKSLCQAK